MCAISMIGLVGNVRMLEKTMMTTFLGSIGGIMDRRELQKFILNPKLLECFNYYTRLRYELFSRCYQINVFVVSTYSHNLAYSVINKTSETFNQLFIYSIFLLI